MKLRGRLGTSGERGPEPVAWSPGPARRSRKAGSGRGGTRKRTVSATGAGTVSAAPSRPTDTAIRTAMTAMLRPAIDELNGGDRSVCCSVGTVFGMRGGMGSKKPGLPCPKDSVCR